MRRNVKLGAFIAAGLLVALALAFFVGPRASSEPDGLNRVAVDKGIDQSQQAHALDDGPTAGYAVKGVDDERLSTGLAGVLGVGITFGLGLGSFWLLRHRRRDDAVAET